MDRFKTKIFTWDKFLSYSLSLPHVLSLFRICTTEIINYLFLFAGKEMNSNDKDKKESDGGKEREKKKRERKKGRTCEGIDVGWPSLPRCS